MKVPKNTGFFRFEPIAKNHATRYRMGVLKKNLCWIAILLSSNQPAFALDCDWMPDASWAESGTNTTAFIEGLKSESNVLRPSLELLKKVFVPLQNVVLPFEKRDLESKLDAYGPAVSPAWSLSTIHRLKRLGVGGAPEVYREKDEFFTAPFSLPGLGDVLFILGHPVYASASSSFEKRALFDEIPISERADLLLRRRSAPSSRYLEVAEKVTPGERLFLVSYPFLNWIPDLRCGAMVSTGIAGEIHGRIQMAYIAAYNGSSGGTLLNARGEVVGVASAISRPQTLDEVGKVETHLSTNVLEESVLRTIELSKSIL